jgi:hypothetical protein
LSSVERGYVRASEAELTRLGHALDDLILAKQTVAAAAARVGWPIQAI